MTTGEFIEKSIDVHKGKYQYDHVFYVHGKDKVQISCKVHGIFEQRAESHLIGTGCPTCAFESKRFQSKSEKEINEFIIGLGYETKTNIHSIISPKEIDIFVPDIDLAIEFNGVFWHSELSGKPNNYHLNKTIECNNRGVRLIHIFETEWENMVNNQYNRIWDCGNDVFVWNK